jgi:lipoprotein-anchoring transpeptidase ErfK/SrfK
MGRVQLNREHERMAQTKTRSMIAAGAALAVVATAGTQLSGAETPAIEAELSHGRVEVSLQARQVSFFSDDERVATFRVGVGSDEWPTRTGEWHIHQIDVNPDWTPPDEGWASDRSYKEPGHPDNPMGRIRIVYDPPRSIHGTDDEDSIGGAESHGSIRIADEDGFELARLIMEASGDGRSSDWWESALANESEMRTVELSNPVPIRVREE